MTVADLWMDDDLGVKDAYAQAGVMVAIVTNIQDPEKQGRVKLKFPQWGDNVESQWARIALPMAGAKRGMYFLPEVDDEVLVAFAHGDLRLPYVLGCLWNGKDLPPQENADGENNIRMIKSRSGHVITFDDTANKESLEVKTNKGYGVVIDAAGITVSAEDEHKVIKVDVHAGTVSLTATKDIELSAPRGTIKLEAQKIEISGQASAGISSDSTVSIKGSLVKLN